MGDTTKRLTGSAILSGIATFLLATIQGNQYLLQYSIHTGRVGEWFIAQDYRYVFIGFCIVFLFPDKIFGFLSQGIDIVSKLFITGFVAVSGYAITFMPMADERTKAMLNGWKKFKFFNRWNKGIRIGNNALTEKDSFSTLIHGGSGSGKTETIAVGTLLHSINAGLIEQGSVVVTDPQDQLFQFCSGYFNKEDVQCLKFSPSNPSVSCGFNPIALASEMEDGAYILASTFIQHSHPSKGKNAFFVIKGETILRCIIEAMINLYKTQPEKATLSNAYRLLSIIKYDRNAGANYILSYLQGEAYEDTRTDFLASIGLRKKESKGQKESASVEDVIETARTAIAMFSNKTVEKLTCKNDIDFESLRTKRQAIFLNVGEAEMKRYAPLINVLFTWLFEYILKSDWQKVQKQNCITLLMEEAGTIGAISNMHVFMNLARKQNTRLYLIAQDPLLQFQESYGRDRGEIIYHTAQCHIIIARLSVIGAKHASQLLGKYTSENGTKKPFFDESDIMQFGKGEGIVKSKGSTPPMYWKSPHFQKIRSLKKKTNIPALDRSATPTLPEPTRITVEEIEETHQIILELKKQQENEQTQKEPMVQLPQGNPLRKKGRAVYAKPEQTKATLPRDFNATDERDTDYQHTVF